MDWEQLIREHDAWVAHNFPGEQLTDSIFGVIEELGELAHAHLKHHQGIRGMDDEEFELAARDAIGDLTIYLLGVMGRCHRLQLPKDEVPRRFVEDSGHWLMKLAGAVGKLTEHPHWTVPISNIVFYLHAYCNTCGWNYEATVMETWRKVQQRDWQKDPVGGVDPEEER